MAKRFHRRMVIHLSETFQFDLADVCIRNRTALFLVFVVQNQKTKHWGLKALICLNSSTEKVFDVTAEITKCKLAI